MQEQMRKAKNRFKVALGITLLFFTATSLTWSALDLRHATVFYDIYFILHWLPSLWLQLIVGLLFMVTFPLGYFYLLDGLGRRISFIESLVANAVFYVLIVLILPHIGVNRIDGCKANQREISIAMMQYHDRNHRFPNTWEQVIPYLQGQKVPYCPASSGSWGYGYNAALRGRSLDDFPNPREVLFIAETVTMQSYIITKSDIAQTRHTRDKVRGYYAVFLDGHAEFIPADHKVRLK